MYFYLSELDSSYEKYSVRIDKLVCNNEINYSEKLSNLESNNDDFIQYLIELSLRGNKGYNTAMEELSKGDLEDIRRSIGKTSFSVVDGLSDSRLIDINRDIASLEECTGISINLLREMCKKQINDGRNR